MLNWFRRKDTETRSMGSGYTAQVIAARESYISGRDGVAELTGTVQTCIGLWESGLTLADVEGAAMLTRHAMGIVGRALAFRGEAVLLMDGAQLLPCTDWDLTTRNGIPRAYRLTVPEIGTPRAVSALAGEVLHFRIGSDAAAPYAGTSPLRRARLTAGLLHSVESVLSEVYDTAPIGSQIVPLPEMAEADMQTMARGFRAQRGRVLTRESVAVTAAGGPAPVQDWTPNNLTPDLSRAMTRETLDAARNSVMAVYGVLPGLLNPATTGPMIREAQRHLAQWALQPVALGMAEEATRKLGVPVKIDVVRPAQAFDAGGRARAFATMVQAMAQAKEAGMDPQAVEDALRFIDWADS